MKRYPVELLNTENLRILIEFFENYSNYETENIKYWYWHGESYILEKDTGTILIFERDNKKLKLSCNKLLLVLPIYELIDIIVEELRWNMSKEVEDAKEKIKQQIANLIDWKESYKNENDVLYKQKVIAIIESELKPKQILLHYIQELECEIEITRDELAQCKKGLNKEE